VLEQQEGVLEQQDGALEQQDGALEPEEASLVAPVFSVPGEVPVPVAGLAEESSTTTWLPVGGVARTGATTAIKAAAQSKKRFFIRILSREIVAHLMQPRSINPSIFFRLDLK
jgi:hypothetical protein